VVPPGKSDEEAGERSVIRPSVDVCTLLEEDAGGDLDLQLRAGGDGLANLIHGWRIQKFDLALTGFTQQIRIGRIQIIGETEVEFCRGLGSDQLRQVYRAACKFPVTAFVVTKGLHPGDELLEEAEAADVPVLGSARTSSLVIGRLQRYLEDKLAPRIRVHGTQLDVYGLGVLLLGESGIGKSECALELIERGHRLVSDDVVEIKALRSSLEGTGPELLRHHMELRGIGIINIKDLFGVAAVSEDKPVELIVKLVRWQPGQAIERLGIDDSFYRLLDQDVPYIRMPVTAGRNITVMVEVAARNQLLKRKGYHPARALVDRLDRQASGESGDQTS
jgi:HPr kinase/phosphorylase